MWVFSRRKQFERKFLWALLHDSPIEPMHKVPVMMEHDFSSIANERFFSDFDQFADTINLCLIDTPWRIQELPDTHLALCDLDGPDFGRRYDLFHRQADIGIVEIAPDPRYTTANPSVVVNLQMDWARLLSFASINALLYCVAVHVCEAKGAEWAAVRSKIDRAMIEVLWEAQRITEDDLGNDCGTLELRLHGRATCYLGRSSAPGLQAAASKDAG